MIFQLSSKLSIFLLFPINIPSVTPISIATKNEIRTLRNVIIRWYRSVPSEISILSFKKTNKGEGSVYEFKKNEIITHAEKSNNKDVVLNKKELELLKIILFFPVGSWR